MPLLEKRSELKRLIKAFENEADKFHDIEFHLYHVTQEGFEVDRKFKQPNHVIMLWQHYGKLGTESAIEELADNIEDSNMTWGIRGAKLSQYGLIEGEATDQFVKMANRAGSLFSPEEASEFKFRIIKEIQSTEIKNDQKHKPVSVVNDNPLAIWLNYLLFYLSKTYPAREHSPKIEPDLFALSLIAIEQLANKLSIEKSDRSATDISKIKFKVAVSFPGEKRKYVSRVVDIIRSDLGSDTVFYDFDYQSQIARPNADVLLQNIYHKQTDLIVVFISKEYGEKQWCGLEWRSIKDLIKSKQDQRIMIVKFDDAEINGLFSTDGYIDAKKYKAVDVARFILERLDIL